MNKEINLVKNTFFAGVSTFSNIFLFVLFIIIGRNLGVENLGIFSFSIAVVSIFELFTDFGLRDITVRNMARASELTPKYIGNMFVWKFVASVIMFVLLFCIIHIFGYDYEIKRVIYALGIAAFFKQYKLTFRAFLQVHDFYSLDALLTTLERLGLVVVCTIVTIVWKNVWYLALAFMIVRFIDVLIMLVIIHLKISKIRIQLDLTFIKELYVEALPRGIYFIILVMLSYVDTIMIQMMKDYSEVGLYNSAYKIYEGIAIIPSMFYLVILPRLSYLFPIDFNAYKNLSKKVIKYLIIIGVPIIVFVLKFSNRLIQGIYGDDFLGAVLILKVLMAGIFLIFPSWIFNTILISSNRQKIITAVGFAGLITDVLFNLLFIPAYGGAGAAIAMLITNVVIFVWSWIYIYRNLFKITFFEVCARPLLASILLIVFVSTIHGIGLIYELVLGFLIYLIGLLVFRAFDKEELRSLYRQTAAFIRAKQ